MHRHSFPFCWEITKTFLRENERQEQKKLMRVRTRWLEWDLRFGWIRNISFPSLRESSDYHISLKSALSPFSISDICIYEFSISITWNGIVLKFKSPTIRIASGNSDGQTRLSKSSKLFRTLASNRRLKQIRDIQSGWALNRDLCLSKWKSRSNSLKTHLISKMILYISRFLIINIDDLKLDSPVRVGIDSIRINTELQTTSIGMRNYHTCLDLSRLQVSLATSEPCVAISDIKVSSLLSANANNCKLSIAISKFHVDVKPDTIKNAIGIVNDILKWQIDLEVALRDSSSKEDLQDSRWNRISRLINDIAKDSRAGAWRYQRFGASTEWFDIYLKMWCRNNARDICEILERGCISEVWVASRLLDHFLERFEVDMLKDVYFTEFLEYPFPLAPAITRKIINIVRSHKNQSGDDEFYDPGAESEEFLECIVYYESANLAPNNLEFKCSLPEIQVTITDPTQKPESTLQFTATGVEILDFNYSMTIPLMKLVIRGFNKPAYASITIPEVHVLQQRHARLAIKIREAVTGFMCVPLLVKTLTASAFLKLSEIQYNPLHRLAVNKHGNHTLKHSTRVQGEFGLKSLFIALGDEKALVVSMENESYLRAGRHATLIFNLADFRFKGNAYRAHITGFLKCTSPVPTERRVPLAQVFAEFWTDQFSIVQEVNKEPVHLRMEEVNANKDSLGRIPTTHGASAYINAKSTISPAATGGGSGIPGSPSEVNTSRRLNCQSTFREKSAMTRRQIFNQPIISLDLSVLWTPDGTLEISFPNDDVYICLEYGLLTSVIDWIEQPEGVVDKRVIRKAPIGSHIRPFWRVLKDVLNSLGRFTGDTQESLNMSSYAEAEETMINGTGTRQLLLTLNRCCIQLEHVTQQTRALTETSGVTNKTEPSMFTHRNKRSIQLLIERLYVSCRQTIDFSKAVVRADLGDICLRTWSEFGWLVIMNTLRSARPWWQRNSTACATRLRSDNSMISPQSTAGGGATGRLTSGLSSDTYQRVCSGGKNWVERKNTTLVADLSANAYSIGFRRSALETKLGHSVTAEELVEYYKGMAESQNFVEIQMVLFAPIVPDYVLAQFNLLQAYADKSISCRIYRGISVTWEKTSITSLLVFDKILLLRPLKRLTDNVCQTLSGANTGNATNGADGVNVKTCNPLNLASTLRRDGDKERKSSKLCSVLCSDESNPANTDSVEQEIPSTLRSAEEYYKRINFEDKYTSHILSSSQSTGPLINHNHVVEACRRNLYVDLRAHVPVRCTLVSEEQPVFLAILEDVELTLSSDLTGTDVWARLNNLECFDLRPMINSGQIYRGVHNKPRWLDEIGVVDEDDPPEFDILSYTRHVGPPSDANITDPLVSCELIESPVEPNRSLKRERAVSISSQEMKIRKESNVLIDTAGPPVGNPNKEFLRARYYTLESPAIDSLNANSSRRRFNATASSQALTTNRNKSEDNDSIPHRLLACTGKQRVFLEVDLSSRRYPRLARPRLSQLNTEPAPILTTTTTTGSNLETIVTTTLAPNVGPVSAPGGRRENITQYVSVFDAEVEDAMKKDSDISFTAPQIKVMDADKKASLSGVDFSKDIISGSSSDSGSEEDRSEWGADAQRYDQNIQHPGVEIVCSVTGLQLNFVLMDLLDLWKCFSHEVIDLAVAEATPKLDLPRLIVNWCARMMLVNFESRIIPACVESSHFVPHDSLLCFWDSLVILADTNICPSSFDEFTEQYAANLLHFVHRNAKVLANIEETASAGFIIEVEEMIMSPQLVRRSKMNMVMKEIVLDVPISRDSIRYTRDDDLEDLISPRYIYLEEPLRLSCSEISLSNHSRKNQKHIPDQLVQSISRLYELSSHEIELQSTLVSSSVWDVDFSPQCILPLGDMYTFRIANCDLWISSDERWLGLDLQAGIVHSIMNHVRADPPPVCLFLKLSPGGGQKDEIDYNRLQTKSDAHLRKKITKLGGQAVLIQPAGLQRLLRFLNENVLSSTKESEQFIIDKRTQDRATMIISCQVKDFNLQVQGEEGTHRLCISDLQAELHSFLLGGISGDMVLEGLIIIPDDVISVQTYRSEIDGHQGMIPSPKLRTTNDDYVLRLDYAQLSLKKGVYKSSIKLSQCIRAVGFSELVSAIGTIPLEDQEAIDSIMVLVQGVSLNGSLIKMMGLLELASEFTAAANQVWERKKAREAQQDNNQRIFTEPLQDVSLAEGTFESSLQCSSQNPMASDICDLPNWKQNNRPIGTKTHYRYMLLAEKTKIRLFDLIWFSCESFGVELSTDDLKFASECVKMGVLSEEHDGLLIPDIAVETEDLINPENQYFTCSKERSLCLKVSLGDKAHWLIDSRLVQGFLAAFERSEEVVNRWQAFSVALNRHSQRSPLIAPVADEARGMSEVSDSTSWLKSYEPSIERREISNNDSRSGVLYARSDREGMNSNKTFHRAASTFVTSSHAPVLKKTRSLNDSQKEPLAILGRDLSLVNETENTLQSGVGLGGQIVGQSAELDNPAVTDNALQLWLARIESIQLTTFKSLTIVLTQGALRKLLHGQLSFDDEELALQIRVEDLKLSADMNTQIDTAGNPIPQPDFSCANSSLVLDRNHKLNSRSPSTASYAAQEDYQDGHLATQIAKLLAQHKSRSESKINLSEPDHTCTICHEVTLDASAIRISVMHSYLPCWEPQAVIEQLLIKGEFGVVTSNPGQSFKRLNLNAQSARAILTLTRSALLRLNRAKYDQSIYPAHLPRGFPSFICTSSHPRDTICLRVCKILNGTHQNIAMTTKCISLEQMHKDINSTLIQSNSDLMDHEIVPPGSYGVCEVYTKRSASSATAKEVPSGPGASDSGKESGAVAWSSGSLNLYDSSYRTVQIVMERCGVRECLTLHRLCLQTRLFGGSCRSLLYEDYDGSTTIAVVDQSSCFVGLDGTRSYISREAAVHILRNLVATAEPGHGYIPVDCLKQKIGVGSGAMRSINTEECMSQDSGVNSRNNRSLVFSVNRRNLSQRLLKRRSFNNPSDPGVHLSNAAAAILHNECRHMTDTLNNYLLVPHPLGPNKSINQLESPIKIYNHLPYPVQVALIVSSDKWASAPHETTVSPGEVENIRNMCGCVHTVEIGLCMTRAKGWVKFEKISRVGFKAEKCCQLNEGKRGAVQVSMRRHKTGCVHVIIWPECLVWDTSGYSTCKSSAVTEILPIREYTPQGIKGIASSWVMEDDTSRYLSPPQLSSRQPDAIGEFPLLSSKYVSDQSNAPLTYGALDSSLTGSFSGGKTSNLYVGDNVRVYYLNKLTSDYHLTYNGVKISSNIQEPTAANVIRHIQSIRSTGSAPFGSGFSPFTSLVIEIKPRLEVRNLTDLNLTIMADDQLVSQCRHLSSRDRGCNVAELILGYQTSALLISVKDISDLDVIEIDLYSPRDGEVALISPKGLWFGFYVRIIDGFVEICPLAASPVHTIMLYNNRDDSSSEWTSSVSPHHRHHDLRSVTHGSDEAIGPKTDVELTFTRKSGNSETRLVQLSVKHAIPLLPRRLGDIVSHGSFKFSRASDHWRVQISENNQVSDVHEISEIAHDARNGQSLAHGLCLTSFLEGRICETALSGKEQAVGEELLCKSHDDRVSVLTKLNNLRIGNLDSEDGAESDTSDKQRRKKQSSPPLEIATHLKINECSVGLLCNPIDAPEGFSLDLYDIQAYHMRAANGETVIFDFDLKEMVLHVNDVLTKAPLETHLIKSIAEPFKLCWMSHTVHNLIISQILLACMPNFKIYLDWTALDILLYTYSSLAPVIQLFSATRECLDVASAYKASCISNQPLETRYTWQHRCLRYFKAPLLSLSFAPYLHKPPRSPILQGHGTDSKIIALIPVALKSSALAGAIRDSEFNIASEVDGLKCSNMLLMEFLKSFIKIDLPINTITSMIGHLDALGQPSIVFRELHKLMREGGGNGHKLNVLGQIMKNSAKTLGKHATQATAALLDDVESQQEVLSGTAALNKIHRSSTKHLSGAELAHQTANSDRPGNNAAHSFTRGIVNVTGFKQAKDNEPSARPRAKVICYRLLEGPFLIYKGYNDLEIHMASRLLRDSSIASSGALGDIAWTVREIYIGVLDPNPLIVHWSNVLNISRNDTAIVISYKHRDEILEHSSFAELPSDKCVREYLNLKAHWRSRRWWYQHVC